MSDLPTPGAGDAHVISHGSWRFYADGTAAGTRRPRARVLDVTVEHSPAQHLPERHRKKSRLGRTFMFTQTMGLNLLTSPHKYQRGDVIQGRTTIRLATQAWVATEPYSDELYAAAMAALGTPK